MRREQAIQALQGLLEGGRTFSVEIQGTSMLPFLRAGDRVRVETVAPAELGLGDLIAFRQGGSLIVHRFAGHADGCLLEKGDNVRGFRRVSPEALVGRVALVETRAGARHMLQGTALLGNRLRGLRAWAFCAVRGGLHRVRGWFPRREA